MKRALFPVLAVAIIVGTAAAVRAQVTSRTTEAGPFVIVGLFIGSIEEGARIFTPVRLLPRDHAEAMGHDFPTVLQLHGGEDRLLVALGKSAGLLLANTLQRYPTEPDTAWPYAPFHRPPVLAFDGVAPERLRASETPLPGLRAVALFDGAPLAFIIDTRGMSFEARKMSRATSSGLDVSRDQVTSALAAVAATGSRTGARVVVYER